MPRLRSGGHAQETLQQTLKAAWHFGTIARLTEWRWNQLRRGGWLQGRQGKSERRVGRVDTQRPITRVFGRRRSDYDVTCTENGWAIVN